jgi:hypothetical protein
MTKGDRAAAGPWRIRNVQEAIIVADERRANGLRRLQPLWIFGAGISPDRGWESRRRVRAAAYQESLNSKP